MASFTAEGFLEEVAFEQRRLKEYKCIRFVNIKEECFSQREQLV